MGQREFNGLTCNTYAVEYLLELPDEENMVDIEVDELGRIYATDE